MKSLTLAVLKYVKRLFLLDETNTREERLNTAIFWTLVILKSSFIEYRGHIFNIVALIVMAIGAWVITKLTFKPLRFLYLRLKRNKKTKR